jgi:hypothetical protein
MEFKLSGCGIFAHQPSQLSVTMRKEPLASAKRHNDRFTEVVCALNFK